MNTTHIPEVSVITPCLNGEHYLEECLRSILDQTFGGLEVLFIDDGSTDRSVRIAESLAARDPRVRVLRTNGREGTAAARNLGIDAAQGRYLAFLDADDRWAPDKLERQLQFMKEHRSPVSHTSYWVMNAKGAVLTIRHAKAAVAYTDLLYYNWIGCLTAVVDTHQVGKRHFTSRALNEDLVYWLDMFRSGASAAGLSTPLAFYRLSPNSKSRNKLRVALDRWSIYREHLGIRFLSSLYYWACYCSLGLRKTVLTSRERS